MDFNTRHDFIAVLGTGALVPAYPESTATAHRRWASALKRALRPVKAIPDGPRPPAPPRDPPTRDSHLRCRRYWPTNPFVRICLRWRSKLPKLPPRERPVEIAALDGEELKQRFLRTMVRVKWNHRTV